MRILVLGAGGPAGVNTVCALEAVGHDVVAADVDERHLVWFKHAYAMVPVRDRLAVSFSDYDYVVPQADSEVLWLAQHREQIDAATVLPATGTILTCQDKFETGLMWRRAGLREDRVELVEPRWFLAGLDYPVWIRTRHGAGARGATLANTAGEACAWIDYWSSRQPSWSFVSEEYLPGRDYAWCGVYNHGELRTSFARERLEYIYPGLAPSGRTGTPTRAVVVHDDRVNQTAEFAVEVIDRDWHGVACVDLREDAEGVPRPTEINAGRTCTTVPLYHEAGVNIPNDLAILARMPGPATTFPIRDPIPAGVTLNRHIDCGHVWTTSDTREPALAH